MTLEHDPEKWEPVFGKRSCSNRKLERDDDSKKSHPALGCRRDIEAGKPPLDDRAWKPEPDNIARPFRHKKPSLYKSVENCSRLASSIAGDLRRAPARELACNDSLAKQRPRAPQQVLCPGFLFAPDFNSPKQLRRLQQALHERDLVDAGCEKELAKLTETELGEIATPIQVPTPRLVGCRQHLLIPIDLTRKAARD